MKIDLLRRNNEGRITNDQVELPPAHRLEEIALEKFNVSGTIKQRVEPRHAQRSRIGIHSHDLLAMRCRQESQNATPSAKIKRHVRMARDNCLRQRSRGRSYSHNLMQIGLSFVRPIGCHHETSVWTQLDCSHNVTSVHMEQADFDPIFNVGRLYDM